MGKCDDWSEVVLGFMDKKLVKAVIHVNALGPIGGLSARRFNGCLPRREEKRDAYNSSLT